MANKRQCRTHCKRDGAKRPPKPGITHGRKRAREHRGDLMQRGRIANASLHALALEAPSDAEDVRRYMRCHIERRR